MFGVWSFSGRRRVGYLTWVLAAMGPAGGLTPNSKQQTPNFKCSSATGACTLPCQAPVGRLVAPPDVFPHFTPRQARQAVCQRCEEAGRVQERRVERGHGGGCGEAHRLAGGCRPGEGRGENCR